MFSIYENTQINTKLQRRLISNFKLITEFEIGQCSMMHRPEFICECLWVDYILDFVLQTQVEVQQGNTETLVDIHFHKNFKILYNEINASQYVFESQFTVSNAVQSYATTTLYVSIMGILFCIEFRYVFHRNLSFLLH